MATLIIFAAIFILHYLTTLHLKVGINHIPRVFCKKGVLKYLLKATRKHLYRSLFFNEATRYTDLQIHGKEIYVFGITI